QNYFNSRFVACNDQSGLTLPDIHAVGQSYGIKTEKIWTNAELPGKLREILAIDGPVLCELNISPEQFSKPRLSSRQLPDGSFVSSPLEDLMPFLDRTEFESNMQVDE
ncbi:MAG TPA: thiamine pyrophosphate-binding protein, partial [Candidatus Marinimicrobia bacterium]|nr:thiamine pyrophosphate-binding protein [Candidatus Neomarinimicrobiota bacterium]